MICLKIMTSKLFRLEPSRKCSEYISNSFKHELDPNGINWKSVSEDMKKIYFGEFKVLSITIKLRICINIYILD